MVITTFLPFWNLLYSTRKNKWRY